MAAITFPVAGQAWNLILKMQATCILGQLILGDNNFRSAVLPYKTKSQ